ncbi:transposase [Rhizobium sp.]|uniref:RNA-guided endonuclease InsQ/TnpB family protein n=1 Tax=Rhizobium sp. TaxID=391 RepID=UPI002AA5F77E
MSVTRRYTFKLYPNSAQLIALQEQAVLCARLWNAALEQREIQWAHECLRKSKGERKGLSGFDQQKELKFIRTNDPAYAAMSSGSLELTIKNLDLAFQAFFKRAKAGAGKSSGYPRYKSAKHADTIPHRDAYGWKIKPAGKHFKIYAKGIPHEIKARGKFPTYPIEIRTMTLIKRGGAWWASIVVFMEERRTAGAIPLCVNMDLIEKFAEVKNLSNGECLPGLTLESYSKEEQIILQSQKDKLYSSENLDNLRGDDSHAFHYQSRAESENLDNLHNDDRLTGERWSNCLGKNLENFQDISNQKLDAIRSKTDRCYKRFSYRWKQQIQRFAKLKAKQSRQRAHHLHNWSALIIDAASEIQIITPPIKQLARSARGDQRNHGAAVDIVAKVNRAVLDYAPAAAIAMLEYKAAEAGIPIIILKNNEHHAFVGQDISTIAKIERKTRRQLKKDKAA